VDRLVHGGFAAGALPEDALSLATLETGVGVWALDAEATGSLALTTGADGRLALRDAAGTATVLFAPPPPERAPHRGTTALLLVAVQAPGVDDLVIAEALWTAVSALSTIDAAS